MIHDGAEFLCAIAAFRIEVLEDRFDLGMFFPVENFAGPHSSYSSFKDRGFPRFSASDSGVFARRSLFPRDHQESEASIPLRGDSAER